MPSVILCQIMINTIRVLLYEVGGIQMSNDEFVWTIFFEFNFLWMEVTLVLFYVEYYLIRNVAATRIQKEFRSRRGKFYMRNSRDCCDFVVTACIFATKYVDDSTLNLNDYSQVFAKYIPPGMDIYSFEKTYASTLMLNANLLRKTDCANTILDRYYFGLQDTVYQLYRIRHAFQVFCKYKRVLLKKQEWTPEVKRKLITHASGNVPSMKAFVTP